MFRFDQYEFESKIMKIADAAKNEGYKISTVESCTGGLLSSLFTFFPGSSTYFQGGLCCYNNSVKTKVLGVSSDTLSAKGAVSQEVVTQMATAGRQLFQSDINLAVSGVAGPGGTDLKPVGTIWTAISFKTETTTNLLRLDGDRTSNRMRTCEAVLDNLITKLFKK